MAYALIFCMAFGGGLLGWGLADAFDRRERARPTKLPVPPTCADCALARGHGDELGCRAEPPRLLADAGVLHSGWPRVRPGDWCGRHTPRN